MDVVPFLFALASILAISILFSCFRKSKKKRCTVPEAAGAWPFIGHFPLYNGKEPTHFAFGAMADIFGPIFSTKLGSSKVLIISSQELAKECYTIHDKFLDRPSITASKLIGYNDSFLSFSPYGSYWRKLRKIASTELLSIHRIDMQTHFRAGEADIFIRDLYRRWENKGRPENGLLIDMKSQLQDLTANISLMAVAGKRYYGDSPNCDKEEAKKYGKLVKDYTDYFVPAMLSDVTPFLGWLEWGIIRSMKRTGKEMDKTLDRWIAEHKKMKDLGRREDEKDYLDLLIDTFESSETADVDTIQTIKAFSMNLLLAGSETSIVVLVWALALLANNPHVLSKVQEELDKCIGKNRNVEESDINDLVYLQAVVKETFRLYPPVPLIAYRFATEDFELNNGEYHVPAGTQVLVSSWKIQRDPNLWKSPEEFKPERFLNEERGVEVGGQNFKLFPFGLGRRSCPAIPLGLRMVHYLLARFLHSFHVVNLSAQDVDMTESNGLVNHKATPLHVSITPRLHPPLYQLA